MARQVTPGWGWGAAPSSTLMLTPLTACCASADEQEEPCAGWAAGPLGSLPCSPTAAPHLLELESPCPTLGALLVLLRHKPSLLPAGDSSLPLNVPSAEGRERNGGTFRMGCRALQSDSCMEFGVALLPCLSLSENSLCGVLVRWHSVDVLPEMLPLRAALLVD